MRQAYHVTGYQIFDLTECKLHRITDRDGTPHFIASFPKKWEASEKQSLQTMNGPKDLRSFMVTEWEEVELEVKQ